MNPMVTQREAASQWPVDGLEAAPTCPVCGAATRTLLFHAMEDRVFRIAPGAWDLYRCATCASAWLDPRPSEDTLHLAYAGYFTHEPGKRGELVRRKGVVRRLLHDALNAYLGERYGLLSRQPARRAWLVHLLPPLRAACDSICRHLPCPPGGGRLLDVGCGNGLFLELAREMGWSAAGVDFDASAVEQARAKGFSVAHGGVDVLAEPKAFDAITSSHVLEHVPDPLDHLRRLRALLKPGGILWLQTPNLDSLGARLYGRDWRDLDPPRHLVLFNRESLFSLLRRAGFQDIEVRPDGNQLFAVFRGSDALRRGETVHASRSRKARLALEFIAEVFEWLYPRSREFLTITCRTTAE